jgi:RNA polymerase-interacting CarD/CdnL/TRCF family regulator
LLNIGDRIVYPNQGVGVIHVIEEKEFKGELQKYYNIHLLNNSLKLMLPFSRLASSNIRLLSNSGDLDTILHETKDCVLNHEEVTITNCKDRIANNTLKVKSGTLKDSVEVYFNLSQVKRQHPLNTSENQMLNTTKKVLVEEISLVKNITCIEATDLLENTLLLG